MAEPKVRSQLFATKSLQVLLKEMAGEHRLRRVLGPVTLTSLGVGAVIGAGIFVATGKAAHEVAGPALMVSYMVAGLLCVFAALCYAEFASVAPVAGSAYTYAYTTLGELFAWIIGWDLVLEYAVGAATVANGWSGYFQSVLLKLGIAVPVVVSGAPHKYDQGLILPNVYADYEGSPVTQKVQTLATVDGVPVLQQLLKKPTEGKYWVRTSDYSPVGRVDDPALQEKTKGSVEEVPCWVRTKDETNPFVAKVGDPSVEAKLQNSQRAFINLPAVLVVFLVTLVLVKGISESAGFNALMVAIKVAAVLFV